IDEREAISTVKDEGDRGGASDGLESGSEGNIYSTNYEHNAIFRSLHYDNLWETVVHDPRLSWPDTPSIATDGHIYVMANQLHRKARFSREGKDLRCKPYTLFRIRIDVHPVLLR
ncbi:MAG: gluconolaconase, partial [Thermoproteota archaeon]|nr:gluconolaconase [Thermoproteota archaeon]